MSRCILVCCVIAHAILERGLGSGYVAVNTVFYKMADVRQATDFGSVELFEYMIPEMTTDVLWTFSGGQNHIDCQPRNVTIYLQHGSYPLMPSKTNKTYPADFFLKRTHLSNVTFSTDHNTTVVNQTMPLAGRWFGAALLETWNNNQVIKKLTTENCRYFIQINITSIFVTTLNELVQDQPVTIAIQGSQPLYFRFFVESTTWQLAVRVEKCSAGGAAGGDGDCPVTVSTRAGAFPELTGASAETRSVNCSGEASPRCQLKVHNPAVALWHYVVFQSNAPGKSFSMELHLKLAACRMALQHMPRAPPPAAFRPLAPTSAPPAENQTVAVPSKRQRESRSAPHENGDASHFKANNTQSATSAEHDNSTDTEDLAARDPEADAAATPIDSDQQPVCGSIISLRRIEDMNQDFQVIYSISPHSEDELVYVSPFHVTLIQFDVMPLKDTGGTLRFLSSLYLDMLNTTVQNVTVRVCVSRGSIPVQDGDQYHCGSPSAQEVVLDSSDRDTWMLTHHFPYPEPGVWFLGMQARCYKYNVTQNGSVPIWEPCLHNYTRVVLEAVNAPCVNTSCPGHGQCRMYHKGVYTYSGCQCYAKYQGYTCEDDSETESPGTQLTYSLLLSLSNLMFIPAIILACHRRYAVEALVYFANMFYSGFYHACDMNTWSIYKMCIMPYHVLSYCDFLLSILSFWVTLLAVAELPYPMRALGHMLFVVTLTMGVQWAQFNLWTNLVPIIVGLCVVLCSWVVRCRQRKHCYPPKRRLLCMVPGVVIALAGLITYGFLETDVNYPYTHSVWHACMALSIVFLLPKRKQRLWESFKDESSDDFEFLERRGENDCSLLPAEDIGIVSRRPLYGDSDDDDPPLDL